MVTGRPVGRWLAKAAAIVLLVIVALLAGGTALYWAPDRPVSELATRWAPPPSQFVHIAGVSAHVRDEGPRDDATPLLLLHGTSASLHTWDGWAAALTGERRVIRVDLPGFGLTGPARDEDYRIERYVEFVAALLDRLGIDRCVVAGNSFGGWVGWESALAQPGRVAGLVLVDAAGYPLVSESVPIGFRLAKMPVLNRLLQVTLPRGVIESSLRNAYGDSSRVSVALVDRYYELTLREGNRRALTRRFVQAPHGLHAARIRDLRVPALILWGGRDRLIPPDHAERFHRDVPGSRRVVFPDLGHVPHEEDPLATVAVVREFLHDMGLGTTAASK